MMTYAKPMTFSAPMAAAIEDDRKTQTRRIVTPVGPKITPGLYWVREPWRAHKRFDRLKPSDIVQSAGIVPERSLNGDAGLLTMGRYRHARFMCRWMSRLTIRVTKVREPEPLQAITPEDAIAEGLASRIGELNEQRKYGLPDWDFPLWRYEPVDAFESLWTMVYSAESWAENPTVTPIEFERMPY